MSGDDATVLKTIDDAERAARLDALKKIIELMRPAVQADGGDLVLLGADVERGVVEVQLQGACSSCAVSARLSSDEFERRILSAIVMPLRIMVMSASLDAVWRRRSAIRRSVAAR